MTQTPSFLTPHSNFLTTLKAWPVIALATIGLCFLTQLVAGWFGVDLPDQKNIEIVKRYAGLNKVFVWLCFQILVLMPAVEELVFRGLLFKGALWAWRKATKRTEGTQGTGRAVALVLVVAFVSSCLFSAAHYAVQPFPDAAFIALVFFGLAQCWLYRKTDHIWCPMLNHALFNLTNLILLFVVPEQGMTP